MGNYSLGQRLLDFGVPAENYLWFCPEVWGMVGDSDTCQEHLNAPCLGSKLGVSVL